MTAAPESTSQELPTARSMPLPNPPRFGRWLLVIVLLVQIVVVAIGTTALLHSRWNYEQRAQIQTANLARAVDQSLTATVDRIDHSLRTVVRAIEEQVVRGKIDDPAIEALVASQEALVPETLGYRVANADGLILVGKGVNKNNPIDVSDREYFVYTRDHDDNTLFVSKPFFGRVSGTWNIIFARRINRPDGQFGGVALISLSLEHLRQHLSRYDVGPHGSITLRDSDAGLIVRIPDTPTGNSSDVGNKKVSDEFINLIESGVKTANYTAITPFDGVRRVLTLHRVGTLPFIAVVGLAETDYLTQWRKELLVTTFLLSTFVFIATLATWLLWVMWHRQEQQARTLRESEQRLAAVFDNTVVGLIMIDDHGMLLAFNAPAESMFGHKKSEVLGRNINILMPEPHHSKHDGYLQHYRESGRRKIIGQHTRVNGQRSDGTPFPLELYVSEVFLENRRHFIGILRDLTASERMEAEILESRRHFETVFRNNPVPLSLVDAETERYVSVNAAWVESTGYSEAEVIGRRATDIGLWISPGERESLLRGLRSDGTLGPGEAHLRTRNGEQIIAIVKAVTIQAGQQRLLLWSNFDITAQREAERQLSELNQVLEHRVEERTAELQKTIDTLKQTQDDLVHAGKMAALGSLVAGFSHELNTPLGNAAMGASTLRDRVRSFSAEVEAGTVKRSAMAAFLANCNEAADILERSTGKAAALVASFKEVAIDQTSERRRTFSLDSLIEDVLMTLRPTLKHQPWGIHVDIPPAVQCDSYPGPLGQVLANLVQNASLHGLSGREHGTISITGRSLEGGLIELSVMDDGVGMSAEIQKRIFDPFFTTRLGQGGSGLGLSVSYNIVTALLGGTIQVESKPDEGTRFTLILPRQAPANPD